MGMILRIASSRIVGQGDIVGRSGYFSLNLSANSVMRGRLDARRTLKSLVADLRDDILCREGDNRTIGLLLCKSKDRIKAEYALRDIQKPIGISDYELGHALPKDFRGSLPTIEEIEKELASDNQ